MTGLKNQLHAKVWEPVFPRGVALLLHGLGDHSERFNHFAEVLRRQGVACLAPDLPGHGQSPGKPGCYVAYRKILSHIAEIRRQFSHRYPGTPQFVIGHSMGGNLALNYSIRRSEFDEPGDLGENGLSRLASVILCAPFLLPPNPLRREQVFAAWLSGRLLPWPRIRHQVDPVKLTHGEASHSDRPRDELLHGRVSLGLATQLVSEGRFALDYANRVDVPIRIDVGSDDEMISRSACRHLAMRIGNLAEFREWPSQRHDLFRDSSSDQFVGEVARWIAGQIECEDSEFPANCSAA